MKEDGDGRLSFAGTDPMDMLVLENRMSEEEKGHNVRKHLETNSIEQCKIG